MSYELAERAAASFIKSIDWDKVIKKINWERIARFIENNPKEITAISLGTIFGVSHVCETHIKQNTSISVQKEAISQGKSVTQYPDGTVVIAP